MTDEPSRPLTGHLTATHRTRIEFAQRELESARADDLAQLPAEGLILRVERLRGRLDDMLHLIDEITCASPPPPSQRD
ncbi:hypothetical protein [Streptomyces chartreusis]|uniref:hypothetical protein n=1 Tax=Streptomyces chartreusis TaxID=1969 RepID=UPI0035DFEC4A